MEEDILKITVHVKLPKDFRKLYNKAKKSKFYLEDYKKGETILTHSVMFHDLLFDLNIVNGTEECSPWINPVLFEKHEYAYQEITCWDVDFEKEYEWEDDRDPNNIILYTFVIE